MNHRHREQKRSDEDPIWMKASSHYFDLEAELKLTVLHPAVLDAVDSVRGLKILDFGCGEGGLATQLAKRNAQVLAVDKSPVALEIAREKHVRTPQLNFELVCPPDYKSVTDQAPFDLAILSLVAVTIPTRSELTRVFELLSDVLKTDGKLILAESHPCFHDQSFSTCSMALPRRNYAKSDEPFQVEVRDGCTPSYSVSFTDFHRPLAELFGFFFEFGFRLSAYRELYDTAEYPGLHLTTRERFNPQVPAFILVEGVKTT